MILSIFISVGCMEDSESRTPKGTLIEFFEKIDTKNGKEAVDLLASKFVDNETIEKKREQMIKDISNGNMTIETFEIKDIEMKEDMNQTEKDKMGEFVSYCENHTDKDIQSYCKIKVNMTRSFTDEKENHTSESEFPLIKIDDEWYLPNILFSYYLYESLP